MTLRLADLRDRRVVVWGHGSEGRAAVQLLTRHARPAQLAVVVDDPGTVMKTGDGTVDDVVPVLSGRAADSVIEAADVIVKSPGVSPYHGRLAERRGHAVVTGGTALWFAETGGEGTIGITGSKGKSTTSSLVAHILRQLGHDVTLAGNVGRPLLDLLDDELREPPRTPRRYVLELSSFQCAEVQHSPAIGVLTALFPEHLDWHGTLQRYYDDKCNLFAHRDAIRVAVNADNTDAAARLPSIRGAVGYGIVGSVRASGTRVLGADDRLIVDLANAALLGHHNAVNAAGALTALALMDIDIGAQRDAIADAVCSFRPLAHRLDPLGDVGGRLAVDDSLSTAPQAAVAALASFHDRPVGIIVGGHDRGVDYTPLADALATRATPTWVLGVPESGARIVEIVSARGSGNVHLRAEHFDDFDHAVARALAIVPVGGVILLSPAAPSFGRFANYAERGHHFRRLVGLGP